MYVLVFTTLIVALIGSYAQMLSLQTARFFSHQSSVASAMMAWHETALGLARAAGITPAPGASGCSMYYLGLGGGMCVSGGNIIAVNATQPTTTPLSTLCGPTVTNNCWTALPAGYAKATYKFYSVYYQPAAGQAYVITYIPPPTISASNPAPGLIVLPGPTTGTQIDITMSDLYLQFKNSHISTILYGLVENVGGTDLLVVPPISDGGTSASLYNQYTLPTAGAATSNATADQKYAPVDGSFALISSL